MSETNETKAATTPISDRVRRACDIAAGRSPADANATGTEIVGAKKDLNCKGKGPEWHRMVYRGVWRYVASSSLPRGNFLAADRRAEVYGDVYPGEMVVKHDRGAPVDTAWLAAEPNSEGKTLIKCDFRRRRDGMMAFTLPDGAEVVLSDPRKR